MRPRVLALATFGLVLLTGTAIYALDPRRAPEQVADLLDRITQPRFREDDVEKFGTSRLVTLTEHVSVSRLTDLNAGESALLASAHAFNRDYLIGFVRLTPPAAIAKRGTNGGSSGGGFQPQYLTISSRSVNTRSADQRLLRSLARPDEHRASLSDAVLRALPEVQAKGRARTTDGRWSVTMRPVRASKDSCLKCHAGAKRGDILGVMVYAVDQNPLPPASQALSPASRSRRN
ncbi:MAG: hypothetical protein K0Q72_3397 [Armatimonadetes bacterium]|nr:hypothetical protein [Armatimonadota bacterium]